MQSRITRPRQENSVQLNQNENIEAVRVYM